MQNPWFFGYGSLVNRTTHDFGRAHPARLRGWRRVWRHTTLSPTAFLTIEPAQGTEIDGLIAEVPGGDWSALDERESGYDRVRASDLSHPLDPAPEIAVYTIPENRHPAPVTPQPVLLSYLDVVAQGFLAEFGDEGLDRFFRTTHGWDVPVLDDRVAPRYPRHRVLSRQERARVDDWLDHLAVRRVR